MAQTQKVVLRRVAGESGKYTVTKLINRLTPEIGSLVTEKEAQSLIADRVVRIEVLPSNG